MEAQNKPLLDKRIFWDVDGEKMDYIAKANFIIERVFERGDVDDIRQCRRFYGVERIESTLTKAKWIRPQTLYLASALFNNNLTDYRCYREAQLNPSLWMY
jgi:hypothetical protein